MSNIIIGRPSNPDRYVYNPKDARDVLSGRVEPLRAPANLPNIPDNLITDEMRLQNIIDNKNLSKNIPSPDREGMNVYQDIIQDFRTSTPERGEVYTKRFPITSVLENLANSGGIFGTVGRAIFDKGRNTVADTVTGLKKFAQDQGIYPSTQLNTDTGTTAFTSRGGSERLGGGIMDNNLVRPTPSMTQTDFLARPEMNQPPRGLETVFIPTIDPRVGLQQELDRDRRFNLMTNNIDDILMGPDRSVQGPSALAFGFPGKFNQGGIASLNNPEYNLLMNASDFDL